MEATQDLLAFLDNAPTAWHAVDLIRKRLHSAGFIELGEAEPWQIQKGKNYFVTRNGSSLIAFKTPKADPETALVIGSHTDSPALKLKPKSEFVKENMVMLGVEVYGSPILASWLNRELGIAGRVICLDKKNHIQEKLICIDDAPAVIPQLAIHLDRKINDEGLVLNKQEHLAALFGLSKDPKENFLEKLLKKKSGFEKILAHDLFLYPLEKAKLTGLHGDFISAYRLDSLASVHAILTGFLETSSKKASELQMAVFWDNEEVGSSTAQGADSPFFPNTVERLLLSLGKDRADYLRLLSQSFAVSVDLAHALHPNYPEKHEPRHRIFLSDGIVLKTHASHAYASNASSSSRLLKIAEDKKIPIQWFVTRSDLSSGTTIGPIHAALTGMSTVDIGIGQLSMHSAREMIATQDHLKLCSLITHLYLSA